METKKPLRRPTAHIPPFGLRLQPELKAQLEEAAARAGRSLNAEITSRLEQSFKKAQSTDDATDIHVILDASGCPISWREVSEHVLAIATSAALPVVNMTTSVVTPEITHTPPSRSKLSKIRAGYQRLVSGRKSTT